MDVLFRVIRTAKVSVDVTRKKRGRVVNQGSKSERLVFIRRNGTKRAIIGFRLGGFLRRSFRQLGLRVTVKLQVSILHAGKSKRL